MCDNIIDTLPIPHLAGGPRLYGLNKPVFESLKYVDEPCKDLDKIAFTAAEEKWQLYTDSITVNSGGSNKVTFYVRDASGNVMSVYGTDAAVNSGALTQNEIHLYGSSRLGIFNIGRDVQSIAAVNYSNNINTFTRGKKFFELSNHLGNVLVTISDRKIMMLPDNQGCTAGTANDILNVYTRNNEPSYVARQEVNILDGFESINDDDFVAYTDNSLGTCAVIDPANPPAGSYYKADVVTANDYYPGGMLMPGRKYSIVNTNYRYGFNGQERSYEINDNLTTAEYWEYDSRVGRRWNVDPVFKEYESPYVTFSNNPIFNIDPNGDSDSTYKTPGGGTVTTNDPNAETFDGKAYKVGNATVQSAKGTLRSFTVTGDNVADGAARFVAQFNTKTGEFTGYGWDKKPSYTYENFLDDARKDLAEQYENADNPMYEHYSNRRDALNSAINLGLGVILPNAVIRPLTIATSIQKIIPRGFSSAKQFAQAGSELEAALQKSGIKYSNVGVRGSAVTNMSSKGGSFRQTAIGTLKASDVDVYVELAQQSGLKANSAGFIHPDKLLKNFPELKNWSDRWGKILGREITPGGWNPGSLKDANVIKF